MTELKPCPFCGLVPAMTKYDGNSYAIECGAFPCKGSGIITAFFERDGNVDKAIAAWNARPTEHARAAGELEGMAAAIETTADFQRDKAVLMLRRIAREICPRGEEND